jgi:hypothetical protein
MATPESAWCPPMQAPFVPTAADSLAFLRLSARLHLVPRLPAARVEVRMHSQPQP